MFRTAVKTTKQKRLVIINHHMEHALIIRCKKGEIDAFRGQFNSWPPGGDFSPHPSQGHDRNIIKLFFILDMFVELDFDFFD